MAQPAWSICLRQRSRSSCTPRWALAACPFAWPRPNTPSQLMPLPRWVMDPRQGSIILTNSGSPTMLPVLEMTMNEQSLVLVTVAIQVQSPLP